MAGSPKRLAVAASASNWISTAASSPTTHASWPGSTTTTCGATNSKVQPSAYAPWMWPRAKKPMCACMAQTQHLNHEPQTAWNTLLRKELRHGDLFGHCELLI